LQNKVRACPDGTTIRTNCKRR